MDEVLTMEDKPSVAVRRKKDCSIVRAVELVNDGKADAVVSVGNTGGIFAAATFKLGRIPGVDRGGIATVIPRAEGEFVLLDSGANIECKPIHLAHYAVMGSIYSREVLGCKNVVETKNLLPGASPEQIWKEISTDYKVGKILVAGHQPHLGSLIGLLLEAAIMVDLKKGSLVRIETHGKLGPPRGVLKWMITTKLAKVE